jgi:hypothetical protein
MLPDITYLIDCPLFQEELQGRRQCGGHENVAVQLRQGALKPASPEARIYC